MTGSVSLLLRKNYDAMIRNSVGATLFQNLYATWEGKEEDIVRGGELSCALFVSTILHHFKLIDSPHATVAGTLADMKRNGWKETDTADTGTVLVWEEAEQADERHAHIGFSIGGGRAVSNSFTARVPAVHNTTFGGTRVITAFYTHPFLEEDAA